MFLDGINTYALFQNFLYIHAIDFHLIYICHGVMSVTFLC